MAVPTSSYDKEVRKALSEAGVSSIYWENLLMEHIGTRL